jgi:hypothetical protein
MNVFLGDSVTIVKDIDNESSTFITGQVSGVVVDSRKQLERVWIHGISSSFYMADGWKFIENEGDEEDEI